MSHPCEKSSTTNRPINILVYAGEGSTAHSLAHVFHTFRQLLSPAYIVAPLSSSALLDEPWEESCAALIIPGGADLPYCRVLDGAGNRKIRRYIQGGGRYIGLCAGAYYGSARCEFMLGHEGMEVVGSRELALFPGTCRGLAFDGFQYQSEQGARAVQLLVHKDTMDQQAPGTFTSYYNGGGFFVDASKQEAQDVQVLASYADKVDCAPGADETAAAVVYRRVGQGHVLLAGPHPEFTPVLLDKAGHGERYREQVEKLEADEVNRQAFLKACMEKLHLRANSVIEPTPSLSPLHLTAYEKSGLSDLLIRWQKVISRAGDQALIKAETDIFRLHNYPVGLLPDRLEDDLSAMHLSPQAQQEQHTVTGDCTSAVVPIKHVHVHETEQPLHEETPRFQHDIFYSSLAQFMGTRLQRSSFGKILLYGETVSSTSSLLDMNNSLLQTLPTGFTVTASRQVAGRGRGSNIWASPPGSLMFSTVIWHSANLAHSSPVIFVQYLAAMALVRGTMAYEPGYDKLPLRLKWPNDIYAQQGGQEGQFVKIGGVLINSSYANGQYALVVGIGVNVANPLPTTGLNVLASHAGLPNFENERLLARVLVTFEQLYTHFVQQGWDSYLENMYYSLWLHTDQVISLESYGGMRARIKGISRDWGMLVADELDAQDRWTGGSVTLQSDSNSFDFFRGLIKTKA